MVGLGGDGQTTGRGAGRGWPAWRQTEERRGGTDGLKEWKTGRTTSGKRTDVAGDKREGQTKVGGGGPKHGRKDEEDGWRR